MQQLKYLPRHLQLERVLERHLELSSSRALVHQTPNVQLPAADSIVGNAPQSFQLRKGMVAVVLVTLHRMLDPGRVQLLLLKLSQATSNLLLQLAPVLELNLSPVLALQMPTALLLAVGSTLENVRAPW